MYFLRKYTCGYNLTQQEMMSWIKDLIQSLKKCICEVFFPFFLNAERERERKREKEKPEREKEKEKPERERERERERRNPFLLSPTQAFIL